MMKLISMLFVSAVILVSCSKAAKKEGTSTATQPAQGAVSPGASPVPAASPSPTPSAANEVKCTNGDDARTVSYQPKGQGCEVLYTKFGQTNSIASSIRGMDRCIEVAKRIRSNLESAGFKCQ